MTEKQCTKCKKVLSLSDFRVKKLGTGLSKRCNKCASSAAVMWSYQNKEKMYASRLKWSHSPKGREYGLKTKYNITLEEYEKLLLEQNGSCAICGSAPKKKYGLHVDHCHSGGEVRGLLCQHCNHGLGYFKDNLQSLQKAIEYLTNTNQRRKHEKATKN